MAGPMLSKLRPLLQSRQPSDEEMLNQYLAQKGASPSDQMAAAANPEPVNVPLEAQTLGQRMQAATPIPPPQAKGSGGKASSESNGFQKNSKITTEATLIDPEKIDPVLNYFRKQPENQKLEAGQQDLKDLIAMDAQRPTQLDLSPLMMLADREDRKQGLNSNSAAAYKAPKNDALARALQYGDKIQDNQKDVTKTLFDAVKSVKAGQVQQQLLDQITSKYALGQVDPNAMNKGSGPKAPRLMTESALNKVTDAQSALSLVDQLRQSVKNRPDLMGTGKGMVAKVGDWLGTDFGSEKIGEMEKQQHDFLLLQQRVGKLLEGGVLRKEDEIKYNKILGSLGKDPAITDRNLAELESMMKRDTGNHLANHRKAGYDTSQFGDMEKSMSKAPAAQPAAPPKTPDLSKEQFMKMSPADQDAYLKSHGA